MKEIIQKQKYEFLSIVENGTDKSTARSKFSIVDFAKSGFPKSNIVDVAPSFVGVVSGILAATGLLVFLTFFYDSHEN